MKKSWPVLLGLLLLAGPAAALAQYTTSANADNTINIVRDTGAFGIVTVPPTIGGTNVTTIGQFSFANISNLTNVTISSGAASVNNFAFYLSTNLASVSIPASVTNIGSNVFTDCYSLTNIAVNAGNSFYSSTNGVLFAQTTLMQYPEGLAGSYVISNGITSIGNYAFAICRGLTSITIPPSVTNLGQYAFDYCSNLTSVAIGNGVNSLGAGVFLGCDDLADVTIGSGVTNLGADAFQGCTNLASITVDVNNSVYSSSNGVLFDKSGATLLQCPEALAGGSYTIPMGVTTIGSNAFEYCLLTNLVIPNTVTSIEDDAFSQSSLASVTINNGILSIGTNAFYECYNLTNVLIPASVTNLADYAFEGCTNLKSIHFKGNAPKADCTVFLLDTNVKVYYLAGATGWSNSFACVTAMQEPAGSLQVTITPAGAITAGAQWQVDAGPSQISGATVANLFVGNHTVSFTPINGWTTPSNQIVSVAANSTATTTGAYVAIPTSPFVFTTNSDNTVTLASYAGPGGAVTIPPTNSDGLAVTVIGPDAFLGDILLTNVSIPASVASIGEESFADCSNLVSIVLPDGVTNVGDGAFSNCVSLTNATLGSVLASIQSNTFFGCASLPYATIPASVTSIGGYAFQSCAALQSVYFLGSNAPSADSTIFNFDTLTSYYLPGANGWSGLFGGALTALWNPQITNDANFGVSNNIFGFDVTGTNNFSVVVAAATNLSNPVWVPLTNTTLHNFLLYFSDPQWTSYSNRFYMLQMP